MNCDCKDWEASNKEIQRIFTQAHFKGIESYKGKEFVCCPWCGKELGNYEYTEYKPIIISDGTAPIRKDCWMNGKYGLGGSD